MILIIVTSSVKLNIRSGPSRQYSFVELRRVRKRTHSVFILTRVLFIHIGHYKTLPRRRVHFFDFYRTTRQIKQRKYQYKKTRNRNQTLLALPYKLWTTAMPLIMCLGYLFLYNNTDRSHR